jgi:hypothetical protein
LKIAVIHAGSTQEILTLVPIRKLLVLLLLLSIKDRATRLSHEYGLGHFRLRYEVDGQWYDLEPLPETLAFKLGDEVRNWIDPDWFLPTLWNRISRLILRRETWNPLSSNHRIFVIVDVLWSIWDVSIVLNENGGRVDFALLECSNWVRDRAKVVLEDLMKAKISILDPDPV